MRILFIMFITFSVVNAEDNFFPPAIWNTNVSQNEAESNSYIKFFKAAKEESLVNLVEKSKGKADKIYRLTILRSFHNPIFVTMDVGKNVMVLKVLDGKGGYDPGEIIEECRVDLSVDSIREIERELNVIDFRSLPTVINQPSATCEFNWVSNGKWSRKMKGGHNDGSTWIFEYSENQTYCIIMRYSPIKTDFGRVMLSLLNKTGRKFENLY
jgi:hypothetical protein